MSESDILVRVEGVSKKYCRSLKRSLWYGLCDLAREALGGRHGLAGLRAGEFWAVRDVSFELRRGECLGLIGRNGAGKTTLLKMLNGLIKPDVGRITIRGRAGALIALGAGFNPILTGRENIYVNGAVLGLTKREIDAKLDEIVDFAELQEFIDTPVQNYSSGMQVRLGFAIATALEPDVLLLDEVLAVGDAAFRAKCYNRIGALQRRAAVVFVSHAMEAVGRMCNRALVLSKGRTIFEGDPMEGVHWYEQENLACAGDGDSFLRVAPPIRSARLSSAKTQIHWGESLHLFLEVEAETQVPSPQLFGVFYDAAGNIVAGFGADAQGMPNVQPGWNSFEVTIANVPLAAGRYRLGLTLHPRNSISHLIWSYKQIELDVIRAGGGLGTCRLRATVTRKH